MTGVSHRMVVTSAATATAGVGVGMWLQATSGQAMPPGFLQYALVAAGTTALGAFILWHRPRNRYGLTHLAIGALFGTVVMAAGGLTRAGTLAAWPSWVGQTAMAWSWVSAALLLPLWVIVIAAFPDGRFHRPLLKRATMALALVMPLLAVLGYLLAPAAEPPPLIRVAVPDDLMGPLAGLDASGLVFRIAAMSATVLSVMTPVGAIAALVDRFRKAGPVVRQQIKWLLVGAAISVGLQAIPVQTFDSQVLRTVGGILVLLAVPLPLIAAAIAIFRHGLWEIDFVISKGLVYTLSSGVLTALFLGIALLAGVSIAGPDDRVVGALALALLVSFLAQPLRQRLEDLVARLLYGDAPRGLMGLARLGDTVGDSPDAASLGDRITGIVISSLGAGWATVWLYLPASGSGWFRVVASSGRKAGPSVLVPGEVADWLAHLSTGRLLTDLDPGTADALRPLVSEQEAMVAPLTAAGELIGLIACGRPTTDSFGDEDLDLLTVIARESALALRNLRLEGELRQQLDQIEDQAAELHRSRQRLVAAQDEERRRTERDLHDGAQQQLVALAARLRRAARAPETVRNALLEGFADEAEQAVFSLQELARGIYPSLLFDRGLEAALQAHAARLPVDIRIDVDPSTKGRRLQPELEAAFYFVGLEAMTNVVKHAPGARMIVSLRAGPAPRGMILEVHDDGPGFDAATAMRRGGLQNMADRIGAVGGSLSVESRPGAGTWIRAEAPEEAGVTDLRSRQATL
ncbi:MAG: GAF domain-containing protein [Acidimicrobiia bacterium]